MSFDMEVKENGKLRKTLDSVKDKIETKFNFQQIHASDQIICGMESDTNGINLKEGNLKKCH